DPVNILTKLNQKLVETLKQTTSSNEDGMDVCLCKLDKIDHKWSVTFAGAARPLFVCKQHSNEVAIIQGSPMSTGGNTLQKIGNIHYEATQFDVEKGDLLVLCSDGFIDQPDKNWQRFGTKRFTQLLEKCMKLPLEEIYNKFEQELSSMTVSQKQRDDITIWIIKIG
ncbi:MAG: PP2C family protein-serine/threonine phosphatase, partial [Bacteroidales bacterium]